MGKNYRTEFVGMDVHQKTISIAFADDGPEGEVRLYGRIKNTPEAIDKVIRKLVSTGAELHCVYEAGPCGFTLYRHLTGNGFRCSGITHKISFTDNFNLPIVILHIPTHHIVPFIR